MADPVAAPATTPFTPAELAAWRGRLVDQRRRIDGDLERLHEDAQPTEGVTLSSNHIADAASDAQDQDISASSAMHEGELLELVERAIRKIDTGRPVAFGLCEHTRQPIARERLELMPWTPLSAAAAEEAERRGVSPTDLLEPE